MKIILGLLSFLGLATCVITSPRRRSMARWHLEQVKHLSYQQWLDCLLCLLQLSVLFSLILIFPSQIRISDAFHFLQLIEWHWQIICYALLYIIALVEITLLVLIALFDVTLKKDSRTLFKKMNWLAYRPEKPKLSFFVLSFVCLSDALVYLGVLLFLAKTSPVNLIALILGYAFVKACRYTVWSHRLLAFCLFAVIAIWCITACLLYGWGIGLFLLTMTYLLISFKEQH
ncbi:SagF family protein [Streptococcus iniae]|uniref:SagF family protein n=1 Tax=Streptococcus iniae TaxID=1346 RepID=UPI002B2E0B7E|nr:SagF family protein [Streptococcus iniae]